MPTLPTLFISHGAPDTAIADTKAARFLKDYAASLPRPKAIVVASAHFEHAGAVAVTTDERPETIYDFGGFDRRLYEMHYDAPGDPALARAIASDLVAAGFDARPLAGRGFDHGTWVPLILLYPQADIPVVQVSVDPTRDAAWHMALGRALAALRDDNVLVIGSGSFSHNLPEAFKAVRGGDRAADMPAWVSDFADWMDARITSSNEADLLAYREAAPHAVRNHPTDEHLMPLYVALGAAGEGWQAERIHSSHEYGVLAMDAYAFH